MSTPPFIAIPDGVALLAPPSAPAPVLVAEPRADGTGVVDVTAGAGGAAGTGGAVEATGGQAEESGAGRTAGDGAGGAGAVAAGGAASGAAAGAGVRGAGAGGAGAAAAGAGAGAAAAAAGSAARGDVLLVPGFTGSKEDYIAVLIPLAERGWRVAAMDLPGQGGFDGLGERGAHTAEAMAVTIADVAEWFAPGRPVHLVAHSAGGLVAREFLLARPDRVASWSPICSGPAAVPGQAFAKLLQLQAAIAALPMEQVWMLKEASDRSEGWVPPSDEVAEFCARRFAANDPAALADFADILMTAPDRTGDVATAMADHHMGGTVISGALDDAWPLDEQQQMAARLGVPWVVLPDVGHNPSTEAPEATAAALDSVFGTAG